jgi:hypothetical protein
MAWRVWFVRLVHGQRPYKRPYMFRAEQAGCAIMPKNRQSEPASVSGKAANMHG